jgi:Mg2+/Co2+ transporter CorB
VDDIPLSWAFGALALMLALSAYFSIAETAMMAINRYRLRHLVGEGHRGAIRVADMLKRTDRLLGAILIGNTLAITVATTIASLITVRLFGEENKIAYFISPIVVGFLVIVFSEITPKVVGATYPEKTALLLSLPLKLTLRTLDLPAWFVNLFVRPLLWILRVRAEENAEVQKLSPEEIRSLVLESSSFMPKKHLSILMNLFDIGEITVQDIMVPRAKIEAIRLDEDMEAIARQLTTSYHRELPVFGGSGDEIAGMLNLRKMLGLQLAETLDRKAIEELLDEPYFVPAGTPAIAQLQYFQEKRERIGLVVDEYGELMGLVTLEDIMEEIIGKFTTSLPSAAPALSWDADGSAAADGAMPVREVNRVLGLELPTDGPKTLNGLILEQLQDIPEANVSLKVAGVPIEILSTQGRAVKSVRLFKPAGEPPGEAT